MSSVILLLRLLPGNNKLNKTAAIMQPYIFPYIGYYQLIYACDVFVFYDDVNFIKRGFVNRNNILVNGHAKRFTISLKDASQNKKINELFLLDKNDKLLKTISQSYRKAPYFSDVYPLIEDVLSTNDNNLAKVASRSVLTVFDYLGLTNCNEFIYSSDLNYNRELSAAEKLIDICSITSSDKYINSIGGRDLYQREDFSKHGIELRFIKKKEFSYKQGSSEFVDNLSMIDVMMYNGKEQIVKFLSEYEII